MQEKPSMIQIVDAMIERLPQEWTISISIQNDLTGECTNRFKIRHAGNHMHNIHFLTMIEHVVQQMRKEMFDNKGMMIQEGKE